MAGLQGPLAEKLQAIGKARPPEVGAAAKRGGSSVLKAATAEEAADRVGGALWGMLIGDALAMPTHWFYGGERQVHKTYGAALEGYVKPVTKLPGSIMNKSNTGGGGRGSDKGDIIGKVI